MCTVTLNINEAQARKFNPSLKDMEAITRWAQKIIDGGYYGSCGNITITNGVTSVTATKGEDAQSIGAGNGGSYGTVTVMGAVGGIDESPYTYPEAN